MIHLATGLVLDRPWPWIGEYEVRFTRDVEPTDDPRDTGLSWQVWHWPTETVESDWFSASDAFAAAAQLATNVRLSKEERTP